MHEYRVDNNDSSRLTSELAHMSSSTAEDDMVDFDSVKYTDQHGHSVTTQERFYSGLRSVLRNSAGKGHHQNMLESWDYRCKARRNPG